jgi:predicted DNA-binding transcriptional regulator AlpA
MLVVLMTLMVLAATVVPMGLAAAATALMALLEFITPMQLAAFAAPIAMVALTAASTGFAVMPKAPGPDPEPELVPVKVAARMCGMSTASWVRKSASLLTPAPIRIGGGGMVRYRRAELLAWIEHGCPERKRWEAIRDNAMAPR